ncbi:MAG: carbonic anhydrase [Candidatus Tyrphobacter sp.]
MNKLAPAALEALENLMAGNARARSGLPLPLPSQSRREELAKGQHPFAVVLTCVDSRVAPELVFHQEPGSLFVTRVLGSALEPASLAAIEFAIEKLHVPLVYILGHSGCAAYRADANKIAKNVLRVVNALPKRSRLLRAALKENAAGIAGGVYDIATASVTRLL